MSTPKSTRVTNVQVPGAEPAPVIAAPPVEAKTPAEPGPEPEPEASLSRVPAAALEALRAQIRDEERANARAELGQHIQAASAAITASAVHSKADYRNMHATDINPATLTAPVMTLDGYLCPPAPEAKK